MAERVNIVFPDTQQEGTESVISTWLRKVGDTVAIHDPIVEISTDKVNVEVPSPGTGVLVEILKSDGDAVIPGEVLGRIELGKAELVSNNPNIPHSTSKPAVPSQSATAAKGDTDLSPAVRRLVFEHKVDVSQIKGTGKAGRITYDDVLAFIENRPPAEAQTAPLAAANVGASTRVPHTSMQIGRASCRERV